jgi:hypothetical protein
MRNELKNIVSSFELEFKGTHFVLKLKENELSPISTPGSR